mmetsp:Transcript_11844/g.36104  ORF Transcript_11844/g.36104 Transcript_11844/m.36104 type:complete len:185 (+) Transcript_11844:180-734(+)|eukprot:CAMPEP_0198722326 /NCGR_PEP_ID=MMETSP1475-20131203/95_1 /TAXON_ID= ORGANISM="Unidentified sp., Strain CCMP1999" /NCGR_SAMPLE_ID=MMETSP1475 /ASSEMBLY_ACC=CAM_ASM_001111 /LENGTH=184 /DNA_ID=CAMNT_0044483229 /DNA_START=147 /DNA_END=701 /DNA_ORIENTATION=-
MTRVLAAIVLLSSLCSLSLGCSCLPATDLERFKQHDFVYTVLVEKREEVPVETPDVGDDLIFIPFGEVVYTVKLEGILKSGGFSDEDIGASVKLYTPLQSATCGVSLSVGSYYVVGGYVDGENLRQINLCGTNQLLEEECAKTSLAAKREFCNLFSVWRRAEKRFCLRVAKSYVNICRRNYGCE